MSNEVKANEEIDELIFDIITLLKKENALLSTIRNPMMLISGLRELRDMIEMTDIKNSIIDQIKFLLTNKIRAKKSQNPFEGHMLHSVICGNPGSGKTTIAKILAKIWMSLGFISTNAKSNDNGIKKTKSDTNISYAFKIHDLEKKISKMNEKLSEINAISSELRKSLVSLKKKHVESELDHAILLIQDLKRKLSDQEHDKKSKTPEVLRKQNQGLIQGISDLIKYPKDDVQEPKFIIATREDLVAEYLGQTAPKTKRVLDSARGGVLFIDEAYSLCNMDGGSKDKFGEECLTTINEYMSLHPNEIIIIFAGYKEKMLKTIFKIQPGLFRRCAWFFEIKDYTYEGLARIFVKQLEKNFWKLSEDVDIEKVIFDNRDIILDGGGGTEKLGFYVKIEYGKRKFKDSVMDSNKFIHDSIITYDMIENALIRYRNHLADRVNNEDLYSYIYI